MTAIKYANSSTYCHKKLIRCFSSPCPLNPSIYFFSIYILEEFFRQLPDQSIARPTAFSFIIKRRSRKYRLNFIQFFFSEACGSTLRYNSFRQYSLYSNSSASLSSQFLMVKQLHICEKFSAMNWVKERSSILVSTLSAGVSSIHKMNSFFA